MSRAPSDPLQSLQRLFTAEDAEAAGVASWTLSRMVKAGDVYRVAHGVYLPASMAPDGRTFAGEAASRFPQALICLRTAAELHGLTTEARDTAFLAMPLEYRPRPLSLGNPIDGIRPIRWLRWGDKSMTLGVETLEIHGVLVPITSPARTVIDYFRYKAAAQTGARRGVFGKEEVLEVLDRYLEGRDADEALMSLASSFGLHAQIDAIMDGRRALVTRRF
jgi:predicted transcriptional regulator of viral defense system